MAACFDTADPSVAERIPMTGLVAGDYVLSEMGKVSRVIVNQHREALQLKSTLLTLAHSNGSLSLTSNHVIEIDGVMGACTPHDDTC